jgi:hypothetical protein
MHGKVALQSCPTWRGLVNSSPPLFPPPPIHLSLAGSAFRTQTLFFTSFSPLFLTVDEKEESFSFFDIRQSLVVYSLMFS